MQIILKKKKKQIIKINKELVLYFSSFFSIVPTPYKKYQSNFSAEISLFLYFGLLQQHFKIYGKEFLNFFFLINGTLNQYDFS